MLSVCRKMLEVVVRSRKRGRANIRGKLFQRYFKRGREFKIALRLKVLRIFLVILGEELKLQHAASFGVSSCSKDKNKDNLEIRTYCLIPYTYVLKVHALITS